MNKSYGEGDGRGQVSYAKCSEGGRGGRGECGKGGVETGMEAAGGVLGNGEGTVRKGRGKER